MKTRPILAAAALAALLPGLALPSLAFAEGDGPSTSVADPTIINKDKGSLTIHKYEQPAADPDLPNDGMAIDESKLGSLTPLADVKFKIRKVTGIDLKTQAGWQKAAQLGAESKTTSAEEVAKAIEGGSKDGLGFAAPQEAMTDAQGAAAFSDLDLGFYYVEEDLAGSTNAKKDGITPVAPFFIAVPLTKTDSRDSWIYDVNSYPKNAVTEAEKSNNDEAAHALGDDVTFTVKTQIPRLGKKTVSVPGEGEEPPTEKEVDQVLKNYQIVDPLDARLEYKSTVVSLENGGDVTLTETTDYTVTNVKGTDGRTYVTIEFTEAGRAKLVAARNAGSNDTKVKVQIVATVKEVGDGMIKNEAKLIPNQPETPWDKDQPRPEIPGIPSNETVSKWGKITLTKIDSLDPNKILSGAAFGVKLCHVSDASIEKMDQNSDTAFGKDEAVDQIADEFLNITGGNDKTTVTTDDSGEVEIQGLRHLDWQNDAKGTPGKISLTGDNAPTYNAYCLVEKTAPEGYEALPAPVPFLITEKTMAGTEDANLPVEIMNVKENGGFQLPKTGGMGIGVAVLAGGLLVAGGGFVAFANKKRRQQKSH